MCTILRFILFTVLFGVCSLTTFAAPPSQKQIDFWCDGRLSTEARYPVLPPELPELVPGEIDRPSNSGLTLLGTASVHLLRQVVVTRGDHRVRDAFGDRKFLEAVKNKYFKPGTVHPQMIQKMDGLIANSSDDPRTQFADRWTGGTLISFTLSHIEKLIAAGADVDAPMFADLCLTPRDLILRSFAEAPASSHLKPLIERLPPERAPPGSKGRLFREQTFLGDPQSNAFFELTDSPLKPENIAALVPTKMRPCKIAPSPPLGICRNRASRESVRIANLWNPVGAPPLGDPSRDVAWFTLLSRVSAVARDEFYYRDGRRCRKIFEESVEADCAQSPPVAAKLGRGFANLRYQGRRGAYTLRGDEMLPDGYHQIGDPPVLRVVRAGTFATAGFADNAPVAFIGPDIGSHHDVVDTDGEMDTWNDRSLVDQLRKLPVLVKIGPAGSFRCDARCRSVLATEAIAATADWKHHLRPLAVDALFAVDTDIGLFVDNSYFASTAQMDALAHADSGLRGLGRYLKARMTPAQPGAAASSLSTRSVLGRTHTPFVGYTLLPDGETVARQPKYRTTGLHALWKSYPEDCTLAVVLARDDQRDGLACIRHAGALRLSVESGPLANRVVALIENRRVVLSNRVCLVDARDTPVSGWEDVCVGARRRVPLVVVLRHELGHSLGLHDIGIKEESVADVMDETIDQTMRFTAQSRQAARAAINTPRSTHRHVNGMLRLADDGTLEHIEH